MIPFRLLLGIRFIDISLQTQLRLACSYAYPSRTHFVCQTDLDFPRQRRYNCPMKVGNHQAVFPAIGSFR